MINKNIKWLLIASLSIVACNNDEDSVTEIPVTSGSANFSKYVALGDSYAAGYSDGALFKAGQQTSYPAILAGQFAEAGGGVFTIPFMNDNIGGLLFSGNPIPKQGKRLFYTGNVSSPVAPVPGTISTDIVNHLSGVFNNMGVPGAKVVHLLAPNYGNPAGVLANPRTANPYYVRFASSTTSKIIDDAINQAPTFFSLWIGGNDVMGFALAGGVTTSQDPVSGDDITPTAVFDGAYNSLITQLTAGGRGGVVANLPYVTSLPQFTTVPYNPLTATALGNGNGTVGVATINALNAQLYGPLKGALTALGHGGRINLLSTTAPNPLLIKDETLTNLAPQLNTIFQGAPFNMSAAQAGLFAATFGQARQTTAADLVPLTSQLAIGTAPTATNSGLGFAPPAPLDKFGVTFPLQDVHILIADEVAQIKTATDAYNATIQSVATSKGLAFVDLKTIMGQLATTGITESGYTLTSAFVTGGAFSLDGIHPSPRGYAYMTNRFIDAINAKYGSTLRKVNIGTYRVLFPAVLN